MNLRLNRTVRVLLASGIGLALSDAPCKNASVWAWLDDGTTIRFEDYWDLNKSSRSRPAAPPPRP